MLTLLAELAPLVAAAAVALAALSLVATTDLRAALGVLLDLLLAAGLLGLATADTWAAIATATAVVGVRLLVKAGLAHSGRRQVDWGRTSRGTGSA